MGLFGGSNGAATQTTVPWRNAQPYIQRGMARAGALLNRGSGFRAPNFRTYVPMSSQTQRGLGSIWGAAQGGNPLAGQSQAAISGILNGDINQKYNDLYANSDNAHFAAATDAQATKIADEQARYYGDSGRFGSDVANAGMTKAIGDFREQALSNNWNQNIANQRGILGDQTQGRLGAVAAAPGAYDQRFLPGRAMGQVGSAYDDLAARRLQSQVDRYNTNQQSGWNRLGAYNGAINGSSGGYNTSTSTVQPPSNPFGAALGGALGGGKLGGIPGAVGGGILGLLSQYL